MIIYNVLQHNYHNWHSPESWSLLLMSCLLKTTEEDVHSDNSSKNTNARFKRREAGGMFNPSSHMPIPKHKAKHRYTIQKQLFWLLHKTNKPLFLGYISVFSFVF